MASDSSREEMLAWLRERVVFGLEHSSTSPFAQGAAWVAVTVHDWLIDESRDADVELLGRAPVRTYSE